MDIKILTGCALQQLPTLADQSVNCCVTSPPYWGLRDYGVDGQLGLEKTPEEYVAAMVAVFREVRRVLRDDGTLWLNLGDSYCNTEKWGGSSAGGKHTIADDGSIPSAASRTKRPQIEGIKQKDLIGIPWAVAFALRADGWYLRSDIIWHKPNCMPESVTDRPTRCHEYIFLLTKSRKYFYDAAAISEPLAYGSVERLSQPNIDEQHGSDRVPGKTNGAMKAVYKEPYRGKSTKDYASGKAQDASATKARIVDRILAGEIVTRNKRSVWKVSTANYKDAHFATFPPDLIRPCILAGSPPGGTVLDPFAGSGTTGQVAMSSGRGFIGVELNPEYVTLIKRRMENTQPGFM